MTFIDLKRPICLPINEPLRSRVHTDANPFVAGWGLTKEGGKEQSPILLQLQVPVVSDNNNNNKDSNRHSDRQKQLINRYNS